MYHKLADLFNNLIGLCINDGFLRRNTLRPEPDFRLVEERVDVLLDDLVEEHLGHHRMRRFGEFERHREIQFAFFVRRFLARREFPAALQVLEGVRVDGDGRDREWPDQVHVRGVRLADEGREADHQVANQFPAVFFGPLNCRLFAPGHESVIFIHLRNHLKDAFGRISQSASLAVNLPASQIGRNAANRRRKCLCHILLFLSFGEFVSVHFDVFYLLVAVLRHFQNAPQQSSCRRLRALQ